MHPLGSGEHLVAALRERGVTVEEDEERRFWRGDGRDARTAIEAFVACAGEIAETEADDEEQLVDRFAGGDLLMFESGPAWTHDAVDRWNDDAPPDAYSLDFSRQFDFEDADGEHLYMERLGLEIRTPPDPHAGAAREATIYGCAGPPGSPAELAAHEPLPGNETRNGSVAWHEAVAASAAYQRVLSGPIDYFRITQGPV